MVNSNTDKKMLFQALFIFIGIPLLTIIILGIIFGISVGKIFAISGTEHFIYFSIPISLFLFIIFYIFILRRQKFSKVLAIFIVVSFIITPIFANFVSDLNKVEMEKIDTVRSLYGYGNYYVKGYFVIKSEEDWHKAMNTTDFSKVDENLKDEANPDIDFSKINFSKEMLIAVFMGLTSAEYNIEIKKIREFYDEIIITVEKQIYQGSVVAIMSYPHDIVKIKKSDKQIRFEEGTYNTYEFMPNSESRISLTYALGLFIGIIVALFVINKEKLNRFNLKLR